MNHKHSNKYKNRSKEEESISTQSSSTESSSSSSINRPRNYLIQDATIPYIFTTQLVPSTQYVPINKPREITLHIHQSSNEDTWPGGALWDIGLLLAKLFVSIYNYNNTNHHNTNTALSSQKKKNPTTSLSSMESGTIQNSTTKLQSSSSSSPTRTTTTLPVIPRWMIPSPIPSSDITLKDNHNNTTTITNTDVELFTWPTSYTWWKHAVVLELGCGVGLTGLVISAIFKNQLTLLTDLPVVIDSITKENIRLNSSALYSTHINNSRKQGTTSTTVLSSSSSMITPKIYALPLCWGNRQDELSCSQWIQKHSIPMVTSNTTITNSTTSSTTSFTTSMRQPNIIVIGDVAYQHKPGSPSHFDALVSTVLQFVNPDTLILLGLRIRMPASKDLLLLFQSTFLEVLFPPIEAHELDVAFHPHHLHGKKT